MNTFEYKISPLLIIHNELFNSFVDELNDVDIESFEDLVDNLENAALKHIDQSYWGWEITNLYMSFDKTILIYNNTEIAKIQTEELLLMVKNFINIKFVLNPSEPKVYSGIFTFNETQSATYWIKPFIFNSNFDYLFRRFTELNGEIVKSLIEAIESLEVGGNISSSLQIEEWVFEITPDRIKFYFKSGNLGEIPTTEFLNMLKLYYAKLSEFEANC